MKSKHAKQDKSAIKIKLTNDLLDQICFKQIPVGVDGKGKLLTIPNTVSLTKTAMHALLLTMSFETPRCLASAYGSRRTQ